MATATTNANAASEVQANNNQVAQISGVYFDAEQAKLDIVNNWKWIMAGGVASVLAGTLILCTPIFTTAVAGAVITALLLLIGTVNLAGIFFTSDGVKLDSFLIGVVQILTACLMMFYPVESVVSMTILIASVFMAKGAIQIGLALQAQEIPGWGRALASGICTVALSSMIIAGLPEAALWVIGLLVGVTMITNGGAHIGMAFEGRKLAKAAT